MSNLKFKPRITPLDPLAVDIATAKLLQKRERKWGKAFNVTRTIANAPAILKMMDAVWDSLGRTSLSVGDRELIAMEMAASNGCHYCVPAHRYAIHEESGFDATTIEKLERVSLGQTLSDDSRLCTMQRLVRLLVEKRGGLSDTEFESFQSEGISPQQMIETIAEIAHCTVTNFTNRLAQTPLDSFTEKYC